MHRNHHFRSDLRDRIPSGDKFTRLITILLLSLAEVGDMRKLNVISAFGAKIQARYPANRNASRGSQAVATVPRKGCPAALTGHRRGPYRTRRDARRRAGGGACAHGISAALHLPLGHSCNARSHSAGCEPVAGNVFGLGKLGPLCRQRSVVEQLYF